MLTINTKLLFISISLIKWISQYLPSANLILYYFAHAIYLLYAQFSLIQFFAAIFPYIIKFILPTNPKATISQLLLNTFNNLDIKNRNRISNRDDPYGILVSINIVLLSQPLNIILVMRSIKKAQINLVIQSGRPFFLKIHRSLSYDILSKTPLRSKLSVDTTHSGRACHTTQTLEVIRERAKKVDRFLFALIYINSIYKYYSSC